MKTLDKEALEFITANTDKPYGWIAKKLHAQGYTTRVSTVLSTNDISKFALQNGIRRRAGFKAGYKAKVTSTPTPTIDKKQLKIELAKAALSLPVISDASKLQIIRELLEGVTYAP